MQGTTPLVHITRLLKNKKSMDEVKMHEEDVDKIAQTKIVELVQFTLMSNHFHLILYETEENGISRYMQRVLNAYTKYFNTKYDRTGHLFQGPFGAVPVKTDEQILHLSAYIHLNPKAIRKYREQPEDYIWSSYGDFVGKNRWEKLLKPHIILDQFTDKDDYYNFVKNSIANEPKFKF
jgi:putative transposase